VLAPEGTVPAIIVSAAAISASFALEPVWPAAMLWLAVALVLWLYFERRPQRPPLPNALVCPINGTVAVVDTTRDPWSNEDCLRIRVVVAAPFIWTIWAPTEGKIIDYWTKAAAFDGPAGRPDASDSPNCYAVLIRTDEDQDARVCISSTWPVSRVKLDVGPGNRAGQGRRLGFAYLIAYVDLLLGTPAEPLARVGDKVTAGESILANFAPRF